MGFLNILLTKGNSMVSRKSWRERLALRLGRWLALRHREVNAAAGALISPDAYLNPRNGHIEIGENVCIAPGAVIQGNVRIGRDSSVQYHSVLTGYGSPDDPSGLISIGNGVRIAPQCVMVAANHIFDDPNTPIHCQGLRFKPITIEDDVWIGANCNIMAGVTIGCGSVIGGGSVVTRSIPPYSIAVGSPARVIKSRLPALPQ